MAKHCDVKKVTRDGGGVFNSSLNRRRSRCRCALRRKERREVVRRSGGERHRERERESELGKGSVYDPQILDEYFNSRPLKVTARIGEILAATSRGLLASVALPQQKRFSAYREIIEELGPAFMKIAQTLSTRADLIGEELAAELGSLQDRAKPFSNRLAYKIIEQELGRSPLDIFEEMDETPVAAASFGQVYRATLEGGQAVAVKVQRPNVLENIAVDIYVLRLALNLVKKLAGMSRDLRLIADEVGSGLFSELDYKMEASNAQTFAEAHVNLEYVVVPKPIFQLTTERVLTTEWVDGSSPASLFEEVNSGGADCKDSGALVKLKQMVNMGVACSLNQLLSSGVMHADPHPGNLLFTTEGKLAYIDFGLLTIVTPGHRHGMLSSILHMSSGDWNGFVEDMDRMELLKPTVDKKVLGSDLGEMMGGSSFNNFKKLLKVMAILGLKYKFTLPPYYVLVVRSLATLEGIALQVDADFKIVSAAVPQALYIILNSKRSFPSEVLESFLLKPSGLLREERIAKVLEVLKDKNQPTNRVNRLGERGEENFGLVPYLRKWYDVFQTATVALREKPVALLHFWFISIRAASAILRRALNMRLGKMKADVLKRCFV